MRSETYRTAVSGWLNSFGPPDLSTVAPVANAFAAILVSVFFTTA